MPEYRTVCLRDRTKELMMLCWLSFRTVLEFSPCRESTILVLRLNGRNNVQFVDRNVPAIGMIVGRDTDSNSGPESLVIAFGV